MSEKFIIKVSTGEMKICDIVKVFSGSCIAIEVIESFESGSIKIARVLAVGDEESLRKEGYEAIMQIEDSKIKEESFLITIDSCQLNETDIAKAFPHQWLGVEDSTEEGNLIVRFYGDLVSLIDKQIATNNKIYHYYSTPEDDTESFVGYNEYGGKI